MAGTSQTSNFWAPESSVGFILLGPVNPWRVLSGKPQDLIFKSSFDLHKDMESNFPFLLPLGMARRREPPRVSVQPVGIALSLAIPGSPLEEWLGLLNLLPTLKQPWPTLSSPHPEPMAP